MRESQDVETILDLLQCVECGSALAVRQESDPDNLPEMELSNQNLVCVDCGEKFPITVEGIPVMWDSSLKAFLCEGDVKDASLAANVDVYNEISDVYLGNTRTHIGIRKRMQNAVKSLLDQNSQTGSQLKTTHLDFGCGPGQVIKWLEDHSFLSVGLDVSISNLRNVLKHTKGYAVLGSATNMPFRDNAFAIVTEGSVLHHISDWKAPVTESCRTCNGDLGIVFDSEPSSNQMDWNWLARAVFEARYIPYKLLSYVSYSKRNFRDTELARKNAVEAEIHHQPGTGFNPKMVSKVISEHGFNAEIIMSPSPTLEYGGQKPGWKMILLHTLSGHNAWNPKYGPFSVIARLTTNNSG